MLPALAGFILVVPVGALSLAFATPFLFPSLGPTVFIQVHAPHSEAARPWNNVVGHALGVAEAVFALWVTGGAHGPSVNGAPLITWQRELASALAVGLTTGLQVVLRAAHPPAAATTLLITLGAINPEWRAIGIIALGVGLTTVLERLIRPWLLRTAPEEPRRREA